MCTEVLMKQKLVNSIARLYLTASVLKVEAACARGRAMSAYATTQRSNTVGCGLNNRWTPISISVNYLEHNILFNYLKTGTEM